MNVPVRSESPSVSIEVRHMDWRSDRVIEGKAGVHRMPSSPEHHFSESQSKGRLPSASADSIQKQPIRVQILVGASREGLSNGEFRFWDIEPLLADQEAHLG